MSDVFEIIKIAFSFVALLTIYFSAGVLFTHRRAHLLEVYKHVFTKLDDENVRKARHYVYSLDNVTLRSTVYKEEQWLCKKQEDMESKKEEVELWWANRSKAELICRTFDQLGLLVREGRIPINIIAQFYVYPILRCWYVLSPYIDAVRNERGQPGHMWEFEHLVFRVVIPGLESNSGVWKGILAHDTPSREKLGTVQDDYKKMVHKDTEYNPSTTLWEISSIYKFWKW